MENGRQLIYRYSVSMEDGLGKKGICKGVKPPLPYNPFSPFLGLSSTERIGG